MLSCAGKCPYEYDILLCDDKLLYSTFTQKSNIASEKYIYTSKLTSVLNLIVIVIHAL